MFAHPRVLWVVMSCLLWLSAAAGCKSSSGGGSAAGSGAGSTAGKDASDAGTKDDGGAKKDEDAASSTGAGDALSCAGLIDCATACNDTACEDECAANSTADAVAAATAFANCVTDNACSDAACLDANCSAELAACGLMTTDAGTTSNNTTDAGGGGNGVRVQGRCEYSVLSAGTDGCWDFDYTVDGGSNTFVERYFYYEASLATSGQGTCADDDGQTFTSPVSGPTPSSAEQAQTIFDNKQKACGLMGGTFTEGAAPCSSAGSAGHCTEEGANEYDAASQSVTMTKTAKWSNP